MEEYRHNRNIIYMLLNSFLLVGDLLSTSNHFPL